MPSKRQFSTHSAPKSSGSSKFATSAATTKQLSRSSVLKHAFAPSRFQLALFASVVQGLDAQVLRLHDTLTGNSRVEHSLGDIKVSCLDWGTYGATLNDQRPSKKRKTKDGAENLQEPGDVVIAIGASNSPEIELFSPTKAKTVTILGGGVHTQGIRDYQFLKHGSARKAWSLGGDGKLVEWNMEDGSSIRSIQLPSNLERSTMLFTIPSTILCAQSSIHGLNPDDLTAIATLQGFTSSIHSLSIQTPKDDSTQLTSVIGAADTERDILVFDYQQQRIKGRLLATNAVQSFHTAVNLQPHADSPVLAAVTELGTVEIFENPFNFSEVQSQRSKSTKASKLAMTRQPTAIIKVKRPGNSLETVPILSVEVDDNDLVLGWIEGAAHPCFDRLTWRSGDGTVLLSGEISIEKTKAQEGTSSAKMNGTGLGKMQVDDAQAVVFRGGEVAPGDEMEVDGPEVIDISSSAEEDSSDNEEEGQPAEGARPSMNGAVALNRSDDEDAEGRASGAILAAIEEPVDVPSAFPARAQEVLVPQKGRAMDLPPGRSLGAVLSQSLRTNDRELLETCFHERDLQVVKTTIERLDSPLAGSLLERLAERLHNRPGRAGSLMVWIQWTLVAHGGYLAGQPRVVTQLRQLHGVVKERAQALQPLLLLKGKLEMLDAQMQLRKRMIQRSRQLKEAAEDEEDEVIYIEGQEDIDSEDEMDEPAYQADETVKGGNEDIEFDSDEDAAMADELDEEESEEDDSEDGNGFIDEEAEEADEDSEISGEEIDHDDIDSPDEEEEGESESEPEHPPKLAEGKSKVNGIVRRR